MRGRASAFSTFRIEETIEKTKVIPQTNKVSGRKVSAEKVAESEEITGRTACLAGVDCGVVVSVNSQGAFRTHISIKHQLL
jgi:hypothetical protein